MAVVNQASCAQTRMSIHRMGARPTFACTHQCSFVSVSNVAAGGRSLSEKHSSGWSCKHDRFFFFFFDKTRETEREAWYISGALTAFRCAVTASFCCLWRPVMCHNWRFLTGTYRQDSHKMFASAFYTTQMTSSYQDCENDTFLIWSVWARLYSVLRLLILLWTGESLFAFSKQLFALLTAFSA